MNWIDLRIHEKVHLLRFDLQHSLTLLLGSKMSKRREGKESKRTVRIWS
jgi:hypothetical protein